MLHVTPMPLPGALRLRALHPLIEGDGSCGLLYDLERAAVVEVPEDLQFYIAPALETGDLDEALLGWLVNEDLMTTEGGTGSLPETTSWWNLGAVYRVEDELHARIEGVREETVPEFLSFVFKQSHGTSRVRLHLNWGSAYPGNRLLERIVVEASRLAGLQGQEVAFELALAWDEVTPARAGFLADGSFQVRLLCGSFPASSLADRRAGRTVWKVDPVVRLMLESLSERLTVHCVLDRGRLLDLWEWAKRAGIRHLDAAVAADSLTGDGPARPERRLELRNDLLAVCEEMADGLAAQRFPIDYKPLTRVVDRLRRSEPLASSYGEPGSFGSPVPVADAYPRTFQESFDLLSLSGLGEAAGEEADRAAAEAGADALPCGGCWARHVCSHSTYVAAAQEGEEAVELSEASCSLWRAEVEVALRLYHRLAHTDPLQVRRFFDDLSREPTPAPGPREDLGYLRMPF